VADAGVWAVAQTSGHQGGSTQIVYVNIGPAQGPLVVYRIHNDGPAAVFAGDANGAVSVKIPAGSDCDLSGSPIVVTIAVNYQRAKSASGTYELVCCQPAGPDVTAKRRVRA
jgi:hypothetical protein